MSRSLVAIPMLVVNSNSRPSAWNGSAIAAVTVGQRIDVARPDRAGHQHERVTGEARHQPVLADLVEQSLARLHQQQSPASCPTL